ncbi:MAG: hypothetical protein FWE35_06305 [Streptosporangiales bacterium]|nr:hypothetical protein [Streptosporangiales bacterium]
MTNSLSRDVSAVAMIAPKWAVADVGTSAAAVLIPLGGAAYTAWKAEETIKSLLVARKVWTLVITGRKIAKDAVAQVEKVGSTIGPGETVQVHKMGRVHRWIKPSGIAGRFGATPVRVIVSDEAASRILAFASAPGTRWTIGDDGVTSDDGTTAYPWEKETG